VEGKTPGVIKHRFDGLTPNNQRFAVIIHQDRKTGKKQLLTIYPVYK